MHACDHVDMHVDMHADHGDMHADHVDMHVDHMGMHVNVPMDCSYVCMNHLSTIMCQFSCGSKYV